jgi:hypothetical protein
MDILGSLDESARSEISAGHRRDRMFGMLAAESCILQTTPRSRYCAPLLPRKPGIPLFAEVTITAIGRVQALE